MTKNEFYVYALVSEGVVFYIGKGTGYRWHAHGAAANEGAAAKAVQAIEAVGLAWQAIRLADGLDEQEAFRREREFLQLVDARPLANKRLNPWLAYLREHKITICHGCGTAFQASRRQARACSDRCRQRLHRGRGVTGLLQTATSNP